MGDLVGCIFGYVVRRHVARYHVLECCAVLSALTEYSILCFFTCSVALLDKGQIVYYSVFSISGILIRHL